MPGQEMGQSLSKHSSFKLKRKKAKWFNHHGYNYRCHAKKWVNHIFSNRDSNSKERERQRICAPWLQLKIPPLRKRSITFSRYHIWIQNGNFVTLRKKRINLIHSIWDLKLKEKENRFALLAATTIALPRKVSITFLAF